MKCASCGGENPLTASLCSYCGCSLERPAAGGDRRSTFARLKASNEYARSHSPERHAQLPKYQGFHKLLLGGFFTVFIGGSLVGFVMVLVMSVGFGFVGAEFGRGGSLLALLPLLIALIPLAFAVLGFYGFGAIRKKMRTIETAPVEALPVIVADKRTLVSGGSGDSSASTSYFATCENEDGSRQEYQLWDGALYSKMVAGDAGILYVRAGYGLDFDRVVTDG